MKGTDTFESEHYKKPEKKASEKKLALLLGTAIGDALGVPVEFLPRGSFEVTDMQGYGTHHQPPGTWSDDTSLTLALADALLPGDINLKGIAQNFVAWYDHAAYTAHGQVFDIGGATARAIRRLKQGVAPEKAGGMGESDNGNGSLMRIAPLTFFLSKVEDAEERFCLVKDVSSLTHAHEYSVTACYIYVEMLNKLRVGQEKKAAYAELRGDFARGMPFLRESALKKFERILTGDISALPEEKIQSGGFVVHTLEAALWSFLNANTYRDAVLKAVNLGDDTDTTGAVTGALAGLAYGLSSLPQEWREQLAASEEIARIALKMPC